MNKNKDSYVENILNKSMRLMTDTEISGLLDKWKNYFQSNKTFPDSKQKTGIKNEISSLLLGKNIPQCWVEPLFNSIFHQYVDLPLGDGIHIEVDGDVLTKNTNTIYTDADIFGEGEIPHEYKIVVTKNVSKDDLLNFIEKNEILLNKLQNNLKLPIDNKIGTKLTLYALAVIKMRDEEHKTFKEISDFIYNAISDDSALDNKVKSKLFKTVGSEDNIRVNLYERFKNGYFCIKNSS